MFINKVKIAISILIIVVTYFILDITYVSAQQITLSLSPPLIETVIKPGKVIMIAYNLKNLGDDTVIKPTVLPFSPRDNFGNIIIKDEFEGPVRFSLDNSLIQLDKSFFLRSGETQQLLLRIRIPEGAPEGDYYYTLLAESQPAPGLGGNSGSQARATIGANILVTVTESGNLDTKGKITFFSTTGRSALGQNLKIFDSNDKIPVSLVVTNQGKNVIKSHGEIVLKGNFGEKAAFDILPQNILAESQRLIFASPSAYLMNRAPASLILSGFFIGHYTLTANLGFTEEGALNTFASTSFFAFPFKISLCLLAAIFISIILIKRMKD